jgi:lactoylglutathione lyase
MFHFGKVQFDDKLEFITDVFIFVTGLIIENMHIDHIAVWTGNIEIEKDFFLKYFECTVNEKYVNSRKQFSSYFITFAGGARIELMSRADIIAGRAGETLGIAHIALNAGSRARVDRLTETIERDGYIVVSKPRVTGDGYYESTVLDPENNIIEIMCR